MARKIDSVWIASGILEITAPLHIGGADDSLTADMPLARDGSGRLYIPGTSLAGPLRAWWLRNYERDSVKLFFGWTPGTGSDKEGWASRIIVDDALIDARSTETRDHVHIDATTGGAMQGFKFDREIVPAGATVGLCIRYDEDGASASAEGGRKFASLLKALHEGHIRFGGGKSRGLGSICVPANARLDVRRCSVGSRDGMLDYLSQRQNTANRSIGEVIDYYSLGELPALSGCMQLDIHWTSDLPVLNLGPDVGAAFDKAALVSGERGKRRQVIAGSSIKGALRNQAARICRTLFGDDPKDEHFLVQSLFGVPGSKSKSEDENGPKRPGQSAVFIDDCAVGPVIDQAAWDQILGATSSDQNTKVSTAQSAVDAIKGLREARWHIDEHVAIDRWTGAASDGKLYSLLTPGASQCGEIAVSVDLDRLAFNEEVDGDKADLEKAALALLLLTLRDFARGMIPLGFGTTRGHGTVSVTAIHVAAGEKFKNLGFGANIDPARLVDKSVFAAFDDIARAWTRCCATFRKSEAA